jgi:hypothetical protein
MLKCTFISEVKNYGLQRERLLPEKESKIREKNTEKEIK